MGKTVLVVDDESFVRTEIKERIDWHRHGYSNLVEADNGEKALMLCKKAFPDFILTDIRMPVMDGIVLCAELKKINRHAKIVVLSSYIDFEYVREALKIGVIDYLPKHELDDLSIAAILEKIELEGQLEQKTQWIHSLGKSVYLRQYLMGLSRTASEQFETKAFCFHAGTCEILIVEVEFEWTVGAPSDNGAGFVREYGPSIYELFDENLQEYTAEYTEIYEKKLWVIIQLPRCASQMSEHLSVTEILHSLYYRLRNSDVPVYFSISYQLFTGTISDLPQYYLHMQKNNRKKIRHRYEVARIGTASSIPLQNSHPGSDSLGIRQLQASFHTQDLAKMNAALDILWLKEAPLLCETELNKSFCEVTDAFSRSMLCKNLPEIKYNLMHVSLSDFTTFEGINDWFQAMSHVLLDCTNSQIKGIENEKLKTIMIYIQNHLQEDLGLKRIAVLFGLNKNYLSEIFKLKLGINFSKYILQLRMTHAKRLLEQTELPIKEISKTVGYDDTAYFMKTFSKFTGISATTIRKQHTGSRIENERVE